MSEDSQPSPVSVDTASVFVQLSKVLLNDRPLDDTLQGITELAKQVIPGTLDVSVTMLDGERARTIVFTGPLALNLDERQYDAGFGPCMDAAVGGQAVQVVTGQPNSYVEFSRLSREAGVSHVLSVPLPVPGRTVGALNTYAALDGDFHQAEVELAESFATFAAVAVANAATSAGTGHLNQDLRSALQSRTVIEQAMSILMADQHSSAADAFDSMVQLSEARERSLHDTARSIIEGGGVE